MPTSRNFVPVPGSERLRPPSHRRIGAADAAARIGVTIVVRPRPGSPPLPDLAHWQSTPPGKRKFLKPEEYERIHGAAQADMDAVAAFAAEHGLTVSSSHTGRRHVTVEGTAAQMNAAFGITLHRYEAPLPSAGRRTEKEPAPAPSRRRGRTNEHATPTAETYTHHGYDGAVHIPKELEGIILAVVGLDDRLLGVPAGSGNDPSGASSLEPPAVAQLYNFPNSGASDQTIGVIAPQSTPGNGASYLPNDITGSYFPNLTNAAYRTAPASINNINLTVGTKTFSNSTTTVQGITSTTNLNAFPFSFIIELTQDISTSATIAQGATVNVYFTQASEQGWLVFLNRVLLPQGEKQPTVVTCSFTIYQGDDSSYIGSLSSSGSAASLMTAAFQALAAQGINVFIAIGDWGADNWWSLGGTSPTAPDGSSHVMYPGTDPWVTACGGTVVALNSSPPPAFNENVWSDAWSTSGFGSSTSNFGATGGGVSATFPAPPYQTAAGITGAKDLAGTAHSGRGVPDIAGMVGLTGFFVNGLSYNFTGTSCVAPLYAGFAAVLRSAFGVELGFFNSILYQLPSSAFNPVTSGNNDLHDTPANVAIAIPGYTGTTADAPFFTAGSGWDACTGLGSVAGSNFLNGLAGLMYNQTFYFQAQKSTYGLDEVSANASSSGDSTYSSSSPSGPPFWLVLEGFTPAAVAAVPIPKVAGALTLENVTVTVGAAQPELPSQTNTPQRILFPCSIEFPKSAIKSIAGGGVFPNPGQASFDLPLSALMSGLGQPLSASMVFELTAGEDPSFANFTSISADADNVFYLSNDLRVFTVTPGVNTTPVAGVAWPGTNFTSFDTASAYGYLKSLLNSLNGNSSFNSGASDPFTQLPDQSSALTGDSSVTPFSINPASPLGTPFNNYNFAVARVRVNGTPGNSTVKNVRVFFRLFATETSDTDYQPALTYPSSSDAGGLPGAPLLGIGNVTIPFFATGNYQANSDFGINNDYPSGGTSLNSFPITIPSSGTAWAYFGCYLNVYPTGNTINGQAVQTMLPSTHACVVAQIAFDDAPIPTSGGAAVGPENSDKLAQRNLVVTYSDNPGPAAAHRIPQTFDVRPSPTLSATKGDLLDYPDELMIDWGNTPVGAVASIYWPQVKASDVLSFADNLYSTHQLSAADPYTVQCKVPHGFTFVPIPPGSGPNFAGLFTVDLPLGVSSGQVFTISVRRISTRRAAENPPPSPIKIEARAAAKAAEREKIMRNWRQVVGSFAVRIPVTTKRVMLPVEETTYSILKWRYEQMEPTNRWRPVLARYLDYIAGRIHGLGGNSGTIEPSPYGPQPLPKPIERGHEHIGKVNGLVYDRFGDFRGFCLTTEDGHERSYESREGEIEALARFAWLDRVVISVITEAHAPHCPVSIILRKAPPRSRDW